MGYALTRWRHVKPIKYVCAQWPKFIALYRRFYNIYCKFTILFYVGVAILLSLHTPNFCTVLGKLLGKYDNDDILMS